MTTTHGAPVSETVSPLDGSEPRDVAIPILLEQQGGRILALGVRFCGSREEAEDLVQETFLRAYRNWHQFQGRSSPSTWLYSIAVRICQRMHRRRSGEPERMASLEELLPLGEPLVPAEREDPAAQSILAEAREGVEKAITVLPLSFRMPLVLKEIVGLPVREVAAILGLKPATVKTRLHRARLRVRQAIEQGLPRVNRPEQAYSRRLCRDLLDTKQEALDRGVDFAFPTEMMCDRCSAIFVTLDLGQEARQQFGRGRLPASVHQALLKRLEGGS